MDTEEKYNSLLKENCSTCSKEKICPLTSSVQLFQKNKSLFLECDEAYRKVKDSGLKERTELELVVAGITGETDPDTVFKIIFVTAFTYGFLMAKNPDLKLPDKVSDSDIESYFSKLSGLMN